MESDWSVTPLDGHDGVVLVTVDLRNPSPVDRRVRVTNRLDGPVLPPRRQGVPESGWNDDGFAGVVPADGRRNLGYACPAPATRPPVSVADEGRADGGDSADTPAAAVRELGDPRPPIDAIPGGREVDEDDGDPRRESSEGIDGDGNGGADAVPPAVDSWLTAAAERIERGERLTDASVDTAAAALEADGGAVSELETRLADDAAALEAVAERSAALADRAAAVDVPVDALRRLV
ncbi:DUF7857 domain-containing protein [Haloplanus aerogenes]|uniref:DUF8080 domain-containing protein n=1 Tax=Haloplanus aerogenes TaxID=660522 RepID=A0A3M0CWS5_9EURY|nr:hypothetical protein [Haloplanus aerogenes]AZH23864.1 hypothetical protein DU502_00080 [Haloplanus aerogenes]RMB13377.1 hypothetical protein ATH50_2710 [Haloplanus aerogenes]